MEFSIVRSRIRLGLLVLSLFSVLMSSPSIASASTNRSSDARPATLRLPGHVLPALKKATIVPSDVTSESKPLTLTLVLKRDDQPGFDRFLHELYDPHSTNFHKFLTQRQIADRFGPSRADYNSVMRWMSSNGFKLERGSKNRLTLTMRGTRADAERAFDVRIADYRIGGRTFHANDGDPAMPPQLASRVQSITGLSNLAIPSRSAPDSALAASAAGSAPNWEVTNDVCFPITPTTTPSTIGIVEAGIITVVPPAAEAVEVACLGFAFASAWAYGLCSLEAQFDSNIWQSNVGCADFFNASMPAAVPGNAPPDARASTTASPATNLGKNPQKIGLLEFDTFRPSDVQDWLEIFGNAASFAQLSTVPVNGGVAEPGPGESEVLLDVDTVMLQAALPATSYVVYDAPNGTSFGTMFSAMIDDGVTVISNSWSDCEDQLSQAEVQSIDTILQSAAAGGISVFNGSGDSGTTCLDGSANTIGVPADSPDATAVGGTTPAPGPGLTYGSETWWNGVTHTPPTGQGGYGVSKFFTAPAYQNGLSGSAMRSIPDVVINADPAQGLQICQADLGGCLSGRRFGGTSMAAPLWAAYAAALNAMLGSNLGNANLHFYPLANTNAFHSASSLGSDFAHVGLGSPDFPQLRLALTGLTPGAASPTLSLAVTSGANADGSAPADGATTALGEAFLTDANGFPIRGKSVSLTPMSGSATVTPPSAVTDNDGAAVFSITDLNTENLSFTVEDTTDDVTLTQKATLSFVPPPAASAGLVAFPTPVTADGVTPTDITVTLKDSLGRPSPGKLVQITQTGGNSIIGGPNPPVTDSNGMIEFTAVDANNETVTYSAVDVTDGNLPFPQTGTVTFSDAPEPGCANTEIAAPGFVAVPYVTGFLSQNFSFGGISYGGCPGPYGMAFDPSGNLFVADLVNGNLYKIPPGGGVADGGTLVGTVGPSLAGLVFDSSGNLFAARNATTGDYTTGAVLQLDPSNASVIQTVATIPCAEPLSIDPLSGDLFTDDACGGGGANTSLWRIHNPASSPMLSVYTTLPGAPNANIGFAPNGTMYVFSDSQAVQVTGTNGPTPPVVTTLPSISLYYLGLLAYGTQGNGDAQFLIANLPANTGVNPNVPTTTSMVDLTTSPPTVGATIIANGGGGNMINGPDGCVYMSLGGGGVWKITDTTGSCSYTGTAPASISLTPTTLASNPQQGKSQTFTARFHDVMVANGTPVSLNVTGANPRLIQVNSSGDAASFTYTGAHQGVDNITASATVSGSSLTSNQAVITWGPGSDVTFLTLNLSPTGSAPGQPVTVTANLTDVSDSVALAGKTVNFTIGGAGCGGTTNSSGDASCQMTPSGSGLMTLAANFPGTAQYNASSDSKPFEVLAPASATPTATPTATATATATATPTATVTPVAGKLRVTPKVLKFGDVEVGSSDSRTVKIFNAGRVKKKRVPLPILIEMESNVTSPFSITQACDDDDLTPRAKKVPPGSCEVSVKFAPTAAMKFAGKLMIDDNLEPAFEKTVRLEGTGKEPKPKK
jgi:Pro-kumamolisin, activation domain/Bacterial Ig-like domain (group 1)/Bacterial Ig-like domain (group 3)